MRNLAHVSDAPDPVRCKCGNKIFDGEAITSRCVKPAEGIALCKCKRWVPVPIRYFPLP